jgi:hypothetical protein
MNDGLKDVLYRLVNEIEDLRAHQLLSTIVLNNLPELRATDLNELENQAVEKNRKNYEALRQTISEL